MTDLTPYAPLAASLARRLARRYPRLDPWDVSSWVWESIWRATGDSPFESPSNVYRAGACPFGSWVAFVARTRCARESRDVRRGGERCGVRVVALTGAVAGSHWEDRRVVTAGNATPCVDCGTTRGTARRPGLSPERVRGRCKPCADRHRHGEKRAKACSSSD